ncbi:DUF202 domain-containing protein [Rhodococcus chondri]|uniref:DUF202 domain-containing protein n=1 Tax=Rhodococcus chondri TaxID=3065941 RepID=A0ABU7JPF5_9NOCA|nr:DUF202 domain-containing protein [Rhodococcus sp. CC-R104]MEE2031911.1 DUF202 domain-containing protein [Rhodococcus sp. CC-R104]
MRHDDPGLQPERTSLAWLRTATGLGAVVLGFMRFAPGPGPVVVTIGLICLVPVLVLLVGARPHHRARVRSFVAGQGSYSWWTNLVLATTVVTLALSAAVMIILAQ